MKKLMITRAAIMRQSLISDLYKKRAKIATVSIVATTKPGWKGPLLTKKRGIMSQAMAAIDPVTIPNWYPMMARTR